MAASASTDPFDPARDLTVLIPTHNRSRYFLHYLQEGFWDDVHIHLICDGCDPSVVGELREKTAGRPITVVDVQPHGGVAQAVRAGLEGVETNHFMFCGDDDFNVDYAGFLAEAAAVKGRETDVLFVTMPFIYGFTPHLEARPQYDRRAFHGKTGREVLTFLTRTGEMSALVAGSLFRTAEMKPLLAEPFFKVSEDFVLLARLCARYPERRVYVAERGRRMRLIHADSLSARPNYSREKALMNLVSMGVGGAYLMEMGVLDRPAMIRLLLDRGEVLQRGFGFGKQTAALVAGLLLPDPVVPHTEEAAAMLAYLQAHASGLPDEFLEALSSRGRRLVKDEAGRQTPAPATPVRDGASCLFVGGGARTGTTLMQILLCQAEVTSPMAPEAHFLRSFLSAYRMARGGAAHQIPQFFDDAEAFRRFHAGILERYLQHVHTRFPGASCLVLKDPEMTRAFPELFELSPESRFICMIRDPRDVIVSLINVGKKMQAQGRRDLLAQAAQARDMDHLCRYFKAFYDPILQMRQPAFWAQTLFVRYEDLVRHPDTVVRDVARFTGLTLPLKTVYDTGTVDFAKRAESPWLSHLYGKGISASRVGTYADALSQEEVHTVEAACAELLDLFGYPRTVHATAV